MEGNPRVEQGTSERGADGRQRDKVRREVAEALEGLEVQEGRGLQAGEEHSREAPVCLHPPPVKGCLTRIRHTRTP